MAFNIFKKNKHIIKEKINPDAPVYLIQYITIPMVIVISLVVTIVTLNTENLTQNFQTNIPLNGLIIGITIYAVIRAILNNLYLYATDRFMFRINRLLEGPPITDKDIFTLKKLLNTRAFTLNTVNMMNGINNLKEYHRLNLNDIDARLIKSKVGFRVRLCRNNVGFLAGILVMLGLLGTFWGLLNTIDAVGNAMNSMTNVAGEDGEPDMSGFITAIAAPLQGMGLAFSSSLFGLSGSLLIGFFNFLCGGSQNKFIEKMSLWTDSHLIKFSPKKYVNGEKQTVSADKDEIKDMLAGLTYLSKKTNLSLKEAIPFLQNAADGTVKTAQAIQLLQSQNKNIITQLSQTSTATHEMAEHGKSILETLGNKMLPVSQKISDALSSDLMPETQKIAHVLSTEIATSAKTTSDALISTLIPAINVACDNNDTRLKQQQKNTDQLASQLQSAHNVNSDNLKTIDSSIKTLQADSAPQWRQIEEKMDAIITETNRSSDISKSQANDIESLTQSSITTHEKQEERLESVLGALNKIHTSQSDLNLEIEKLRSLFDTDTNNAYTIKMTKKIEDMLKKLSSQHNENKKPPFWSKKKQG